MPVFQHKKFDDLSIEELHALFALRSEVFVVEQDCVYQDIDGKDPKALHIIGKEGREVVAYARIFEKGIAYSDYASIGRIVTSPIYRGKKIGHALVDYCIAQCKNIYSDQNIKISAQAHLERFYNKHGFIASGKTYLEDGIPHIGMILTTDSDEQQKNKVRS